MDLFDFKEVKYLERDTNTPTFLGEIKSEAGKGGQVMITLGDRNFFVDINPQDGSWKWTPPEALADGEYSISFMTIDTAGNVSTPTQRTLIIDTTPPVAPTLLNLYDDQGAITGSFDAGKMTDDRRPTLTGIAEKGTVVYLKEGNTVIGSAKADEKTGLWTLEPTVDLADGRHNLTLVAAETFADKLREGKPSDEFSIIIGKDGDVPSDPGGVAKIIEAIDNAGSLNGSLKSGGITDDTTPELRGSAPEGSVVRIQYRNDKGEWIDGGNAVMNGTSWSWTPNPALAAGNWEFRANAGSGWTDEFKLDIDLAPAAKTEITHAYDDFGPYTGMLGNGAITDDRTPNLHGRAESNSLVYIHYRNVLGEWELLDTVIAGADGRWEYETDRLSPGTYEFQAGISATHDTNGKAFGLQIVTAGSFVPVIEAAVDNVGLRQGKILSGGITDDSTPELQGKAEANSVVHIDFTQGNENYSFSAVADKSGNWSFTPPNLGIGNWTFNTYTNSAAKNTFNLNVKESDLIKSSQNFENIEKFTLTKDKSIKITSDLSIKAIFGDVSTFNGNSPKYIRIGNHNYNDNAYQHTQSKVEISIEKSDYLTFKTREMYSKNNTASFYNEMGVLIGKITLKATWEPWNKVLFTAPKGEMISKVVFENDKFTQNNKSFWDAISVDDLEWGIKENQVTGNNLETLPYEHAGSEVIDVLKTLSIESILEGGQKDLFIDDGKTQLMVNGNHGDTVRLEDILPQGSEQNGWAEQAGTVTIAGTQYHVWSNGDAELLVQDGVKTELV